MQKQSPNIVVPRDAPISLSLLSVLPSIFYPSYRRSRSFPFCALCRRCTLHRQTAAPKPAGAVVAAPTAELRAGPTAHRKGDHRCFPRELSSSALPTAAMSAPLLRSLLCSPCRRRYPTTTCLGLRGQRRPRCRAERGLLRGEPCPSKRPPPPPPHKTKQTCTNQFISAYSTHRYRA